MVRLVLVFFLLPIIGISQILYLCPSFPTQEDQVSIIAFDGQPEGKQAIRDGKIFADPIQFPDRIGIKTVELIMSYFSGEQVPEEVLIPTSLYKQEDALKDSELK